MNKIRKTVFSTKEKIVYEMKATKNFADVSIEVFTEGGGHGCLFSIKLPPMSIDGGCFSGSFEHPEKRDVFHVLNHIFKEFNCNERVICGLNCVSVI